MEEKLKTLLETIAAGVWSVNEYSLGSMHQCQFCQNAPHAGHEPSCPVKIARELLEEE